MSAEIWPVSCSKSLPPAGASYRMYMNIGSVQPSFTMFTVAREPKVFGQKVGFFWYVILVSYRGEDIGTRYWILSGLLACLVSTFTQWNQLNDELGRWKHSLTLVKQPCTSNTFITSCLYAPSGAQLQVTISWVHKLWSSRSAYVVETRALCEYSFGPIPYFNA